MNDLINQLRYLSRVTKDYDHEHMTSADYEMIPAITNQAADRIEELVRQRDGWEETALMYAQNVDFWKSKLAKAVELALEECPFRAGTPKYDKWWHHRRAALAELEGKE